MVNATTAYKTEQEKLWCYEMSKHECASAAGSLWFYLMTWDLWSQWPKPMAVSLLCSLLPEENVWFINIFYWHNNFFVHICFLVFPRDHTTDFAFVIEHLLAKVRHMPYASICWAGTFPWLTVTVNFECLEHIYHKLKVSLKIVLPP